MHQSEIILASASQIRQEILRNAGLSFEIAPARIDEAMIKSAMIFENAKPRDIADALAEAKSRKMSQKFPSALVLGADQILEMNSICYDKAQSPEELIEQLLAMRGKTHRLLSALVIYQNGQPQARHIEKAEVQMWAYSQEFINAYVHENWQEIRHSVGGYQIENIGAQLIAAYRGDYFSILGLPLFFLLDFLRQRGELPK